MFFLFVFLVIPDRIAHVGEEHMPIQLLVLGIWNTPDRGPQLSHHDGRLKKICESIRQETMHEA